MAEPPKTTTKTTTKTTKRKLKKKLFHLGLSTVKPLLLFGALLLIADGCALAGFIYSDKTEGIAAALYGALFTSLTTTILLLITGVIYQLCSLRVKVAFHLLEDIKSLLHKTEQTLHHHIEARQEKDFRHTVRLALDNIATDTKQQKALLDQLQALNLPAMEQDEPSGTNQESRLERLTRFLNQSADTFIYLQQIYKELQELGLTQKKTSAQEKAVPNSDDTYNTKEINSIKDENNDDRVLQEILTEVNRLQEQLKELHLSKE